MRIREILSENWWKDLDPGFLSMMGYTSETQEEENPTDLVHAVSQEVEKIRQPR